MKFEVRVHNREEIASASEYEVCMKCGDPLYVLDSGLPNLLFIRCETCCYQTGDFPSELSGFVLEALHIPLSYRELLCLWTYDMAED